MSHIFDNILSHVVLLVLYPSILVSSEFIITINDKTGSVVDSNILIAIYNFILPIFISTIVGTLNYSLGICQNEHLIFLLSFGTLILNSCLGPIQASILSILLLQIMISVSHKLFYYVVFVVISLLINYFDEKSIYPTLLSYIGMFSLIFFQNLFKRWLKKLVKYKISYFGFFLIFLSCVFVIYSWGWLLGLNLKESIMINYSMIFVILGCSVIILLTFQNIFNDFVSTNTFRLLENTYLAPIVGCVSLSIQSILLNKQPNTFENNLLMGSFLILSGIIPKFITFRISVNPEGCHHHEDLQEITKKHKLLPDTNLLYQLITNKETKPIFLFLLLNTLFMFIQLLYSFRSKSLGLLSDSLHMALDSMSLFLGLLAGILSKRPASDEYPFALGYLETLAGFTNGILLIGVVSGIFVEACERLIHPVVISGTNELLVVSTLGLLVNLFGLYAFDHGHDTNNENMRGIFLHVLADTLGSVGVIISTLLTKFFGFQIFDLLASIGIALLILLSSIPLIKSSTASMLLKLDDNKHNMVKNALNQIAATPGIAGYTTPRFWPARSKGNTHMHSHSHNHSHSHLQMHNNEDESSTKDIIGYIHIQYSEGENSTIIKKRVETIFNNIGIKAWIQVESIESSCWCRNSSDLTKK